MNLEIQNDPDEDSALKKYNQGDIQVRSFFSINSGMLGFKRGSDSAVVFNLPKLVSWLKKKDSYDPWDTISLGADSLTLVAENKNLKVKCIFNRIEVRTSNDSTRMLGLSADIFLHINQPQSGKK